MFCFRIAFLVIAVSTGLLANEKPNLRLDVYSWLTKKAKNGKEEAGRYTLEVHSIVTNISQNPISLPTSNGVGEPDWLSTSGEEIAFGFWVGHREIDGKPLVFSLGRYNPVTLQPGECTELMKIEADVSERKILEVHFSVTEKFAAPHGWWFGKLSKKVVIGEGNDPYLGRPVPVKPDFDLPPEAKKPNQSSTAQRP